MDLVTPETGLILWTTVSLVVLLLIIYFTVKIVRKALKG